jgi:hemerythrin-like domain-containing protein
MNRYNGFLMSHKGLRAMLFSTALTFQQTDADDQEAIDSLLTRLEQLLNAFNDHSALEDEYIYPLLQAKRPELILSFQREHETDRQFTRQLCEQIACYHVAGDATRPTAWFLLFMAFNAFMAFNISHMNKEETSFNEAAWQFYSDEELIAVHQQIAKSRTPEQKQLSGYWMFKACNNQELSGWVRALKAQMPGTAFQTFADNARHLLLPNRWNLIFKNI